MTSYRTAPITPPGENGIYEVKKLVVYRPTTENLADKTWRSFFRQDNTALANAIARDSNPYGYRKDLQVYVVDPLDDRARIKVKKTSTYWNPQLVLAECRQWMINLLALGKEEEFMHILDTFQMDLITKLTSGDHKVQYYSEVTRVLLVITYDVHGDHKNIHGIGRGEIEPQQDFEVLQMDPPRSYN